MIKKNLKIYKIIIFKKLSYLNIYISFSNLAKLTKSTKKNKKKTIIQILLN